MKFGVDSSGNYGYIKAGADTVIPFKTIQDSNTKIITICNFESRGSYKGFLYNNIQILSPQTVNIAAYACNNVQRVTTVIVMRNNDVIINRQFSASELILGYAPKPARSVDYAMVESVKDLECGTGDILKFGINCSSTGAEVSGTGYYYGLFQINTDM